MDYYHNTTIHCMYDDVYGRQGHPYMIAFHRVKTLYNYNYIHI